MTERTTLAQAVVDTAIQLTPLGLGKGTAGNVSVRFEEGFLITPSGMPYAYMHAADVVQVDGQGEVVGRGVPSSEWRIHRDIYGARPEAGAVVHAHPSFATSLASLRRGIPAFHYMVAVAGGNDIRCADYATFGTQELSDAVIGALEGRKACLMANHGMVCLDISLERALALAVEVEELAKQYWQALQIGDPVVLDEEEMAKILERFAAYGAGGEAPSGER